MRSRNSHPALHLFLLCLLCLLCLLLLSPVVVRAAWQIDGVPLSNLSEDYQNTPAITTDGVGGAIIAWQEEMNGNYDIYAQRIDASGAVRWTAAGVPVCTAPGTQYLPKIISDGAGGAIVCWIDSRSGTAYWAVYAQRIDSSGVAQWTLNGVALNVIGDAYGPGLVTDGAGGAIVVWHDFRNGNDDDIYARRVTASGTALWTYGGVPLCTAPGGQYSVHTISDGAGGAVVTWKDDRDGAANGHIYEGDIYAQRINGSGATQWALNGTPLCTAAGSQAAPSSAPDWTGGATVVWIDYRDSGTTGDIYAQRIDGSGTVQWTADGVAVCTAPGDQSYMTATSDGAGGLIAVWEDHRSGTTEDLYAQRIDVSGAVQWTVNGIALCTAPSAQLYAKLVPDGAGGAIVTWEDLRSGVDYDIYGQRVDGSGASQWMPDGVAFCAAAQNQEYPVIVANTGGPIVAWVDYRSGTNRNDVYAQRADANGAIATAVPGTATSWNSEIALSSNYPNPFAGSSRINLSLQRESPVTVEVFDASGRRVRKIDVGYLGAGSTPLTFDGLNDSRHHLPSGVYFYQVHARGQTATRKILIMR